MARDPKLTTPFGTAGFCSLHRPSTKYNSDGQYSAQILLPEGAEADAFIDQLETLYEAAYQANLDEAQAELDAKAKKAGKESRKLDSIKRADKPYRRQVDPDTDEPLPGWVVTARLNATVRDGKDGPVLYHRKPVIVDSKNKPVTQPVGSGSTIRMQFTAGPFNTAAVGSGLSLKLIGVQVQDLAAMGVGKTDFDAVDGFEERVTASDPIMAPVAEPESTPGDVPVEW